MINDNSLSKLESDVTVTLSITHLEFEKMIVELIDNVYTNKNLNLSGGVIYSGFNKEDLLVTFSSEHRFESRLLYNALDYYADMHKIKRNKAYSIGTFTILFNICNYLLNRIKNSDIEDKVLKESILGVVDTFGIKYCKSFNTLFTAENENNTFELFNYRKIILYLDALNNNELKEIYFDAIYPVRINDRHATVFYKFLTECNYKSFIENNIRDDTYFTLEDSYSNEININNLDNKDNPESIYNSTKPNNVILH